jgi:hypothetical protein
MRDTSIELWLNKYKFEALERCLTQSGSDTESVMQAKLSELYLQTVPKQERAEIDRAIEAKRLADEQYERENRRFSVYRVAEDGAERYFESDYAMDFMQTAWQLRKYLRDDFENQPESFAAVFSDAIPIDAEQFEAHAAARIDGSQNVCGVFDIDLDRQRFSSSVDRMADWRTYSMKDISTAVYHAYRSDYRSFRERWNLFQEHLSGKEITNQAPAMRMEM